MKHLKETLAVLLTLVLLVSASPVVAMAAEAPEYTIKITSNNNPTLTIGDTQALDFIYAGALAFQNYCESNSNGRIKVEIYHSGQLGSTVEALQQCMQGVIQACMAGDGETSTLYPNIQALSVPYLFNNRDEFYGMLDSEFMAEMYEDIDSQLSIRTLASADNGGFRNFSNSKHPIHSAADLKGLKVRCMEIPAHTKMLEALGASACPMAYNELYSALQTGVVDGQENSPGTTLNGSFYEVNKYYTLDGHSISSIYLYFNQAYYDTLPADLQTVVTAAGRVAQNAMRGANCANEALALQQLTKSGMEIYSPSMEEKETFKVAQEPVLQWLRGEIGDEYVGEFMSAVESSKAGTATGTSTAGIANTDGQSASPFNAVSIISAAVAGVAIVYAAFVTFKSKKKDD